jgi:hypothetical protein
MAEYHDAFRASRGSFDRAMETYNALATIHERDSQLRIHATSKSCGNQAGTCSSAARGSPQPRYDWRRPQEPRASRAHMEAYYSLYREVQEISTTREGGRSGSSVEPLMQWTKPESAKLQQQARALSRRQILGRRLLKRQLEVCESLAPQGNCGSAHSARYGVRRKRRSSGRRSPRRNVGLLPQCRVAQHRFSAGEPSEDHRRSCYCAETKSHILRH